jgi:hypothetical protein
MIANDSPPRKTKVEHLQSYMGLASASIGVVGALGTVGVWVASNFYTGDVVIRPDKNVESIIVKVFDRKGQQATFYSRQFQLMPGQYHFEITMPQNETHSADATIRFGKSAVIPVAVAGGNPASLQANDTTGDKHHWWQIWRHNKQGS